ncbi:Exosome complex component RRP45 [Geodia barretti]|uniref:Exosome complex component RRP45 n=1 Tax=Geodia barretti TaxID=519541 RepID=A0AA35S5S0_GEOBA|nr:Exosome complex component RRP45 [Geodia barretti]
MASPAFEVGRSSPLAIEVARMLERCLKDSRAVDTESLCIIAGEKVWSLRVDIHVLDQCGNITDCATVAAIAALKHFRRPDVTVIGEEATIVGHISSSLLLTLSLSSSLLSPTPIR